MGVACDDERAWNLRCEKLGGKSPAFQRLESHPVVDDDANEDARFVG